MRLFGAGAVVGFEISEGVLDSGQDVLQHGAHGVDLFIVAVGFVEDAAFAFAADPAEAVVSVGASVFCRFLRFVGVGHFGVVDAGEDMDVLAGERILGVDVGLVVNFEVLAVEHFGERALGVVDLRGDELRVRPVEDEEASDGLIPFGPEGRGSDTPASGVIRVSGGVDPGDAFTAAHEVEESFLAGFGQGRVRGVVQEFSGGAVEEDSVVLLEIFCGDDGGVVRDRGGPGSGLLAHRFNGPGGERDRRVDKPLGFAKHEEFAGVRGFGGGLIGERGHHGGDVLRLGRLILGFGWRGLGRKDTDAEGGCEEYADRCMHVRMPSGFMILWLRVIYTRRVFLGTAAAAGIGTLRGALSGMYVALNSSLTGGKAPWPDFVRLAGAAGYGGCDLNLGAAMKEGVPATRAAYAAAKVRPSFCSLPVTATRDEALFQTGLVGLEEAARFAAAVECPRMMAVMPAASATPKAEFRKILHDRFTAIGEVLGKHGVRLGLEFLGPLHFRTAAPHVFIYHLPEMVEFASECGGNVGVVLDDWHWHHAGGSVADIVAAGKERIVLVHLSDCAKLAPEEVRDNQRLLAGEGVIDLAGFFGALKKIGYEGSVSPEPIGRIPKEASGAEGAKLGLDSALAVMRKAGIAF